MTEIKTNAFVTKGDGNGLVELAEEFARQLRGEAPRRLVPCIAFVVPKRMTIDGDTAGAQIVTVGIVRIEPLLPEDLKQAELFVRRSLEKRLGMTTLPLDLEHAIEAAFTGIDFDVAEEGAAGPDGEDGEGDGGGPDDPEGGEGEGPETGGDGSGYSDRQEGGGW